jgi:ankyrin repeat protein
MNFDGYPCTCEYPYNIGEVSVSTPVHNRACMFGASSDVITFLLEKYATASTVLDKDGLMPLHLACDGDNLSADIVKRLVEANPGACTIRNIANGWTPLLIALTNVADLEIVKILGDADDETHKIVDNEGNTALHIAVSNDADFEICKYLVDSNPSAVTIKNQEGQTPRVLAESVGADQAIIEVLKA